MKAPPLSASAPLTPQNTKKNTCMNECSTHPPLQHNEPYIYTQAEYNTHTRNVPYAYEHKHNTHKMCHTHTPHTHTHTKQTHMTV